MQNLSNTTLGQYTLIDVIGRGRASTVYKAYQPSLRRFVAIKVLQQLDMHGTTRFEREAQAIARLHHPNILPIFDYGHENGLRYFVTQYIEQSVTLGDLPVQQPDDPIATLQLMQHVLAGLAYAHTHGIIHRDIKPSNILLPSPTWPLLADFGIAKLIDDLRQLTPPGQTVGTAAYIAPEVARGLPADARSDLYSVGVVLYELLTGQVPFDAPTPSAVLNMHIQAAPPSPRSLNPELPVEVEAMLLRALAKDQVARYQSAEDMAEELEGLVAQLERERTLAALFEPPDLAPAATIHTTRKLEPDAGDQDARAQHAVKQPARSQASAQGPQVARAAAGISARRSDSRSWSFGMVLLMVMIVSLIGGMLAAYLVRSRWSEGSQRPGSTSTRAIQPFAPIVPPPQRASDPPATFPTSSPETDTAPAPSAPVNQPPGVPAASPAPEPNTGDSETEPVSAVPTQPPIPTLEASTVIATPDAPIQQPTEAIAPSAGPAEPTIAPTPAPSVDP